MDDARPPRVAILWKGLSGYLRACISALQDAGAEIIVINSEPTADAPFALDQVRGDDDGWGWCGAPDQARLRADVNRFAPDVILVCSWDIPAYRKLGYDYAGRALRVLCMDNQWRSTPRQWCGIGLFRAGWRRAYDVAFVPGARQRDFARRLGFEPAQIWTGLYAADVDAFAGAARLQPFEDRARSFSFAGRLVPVKGIDVLALAYQAYRDRVDDPWPLLVVGDGPEAGRLDGVPGVQICGFVQPSGLPGLLAASTCFVLPSRFEPWGVALHEAGAARLPLIATDECGAADDFLVGGVNGYLAKTDDVESLTRAMVDVATAPPDVLRTMSDASGTLADRLTPRHWATQVLRAAAARSRPTGGDS